LSESEAITPSSCLPSAETAGQISMRKVDGWQTLATEPIAQPIDLAA
jgi:hypothetical protein